MEEKQKVNYSTFVQAASAVVTAVALILLMFGWLTPDEQGTNQPEARGVTNFDSLTLDNDLVVGGDVSITGDSAFTGDFGNLVTIGDATAADAVLLYDGNAQDYYLALDDSADDLLIGLGSTVGTTGIVFLDENQDVGLGGASAGSKLDITGNQLVDGAADEVQLTVQGNATQTSNVFVVEETGGTDLFWVDNNGDAELNGTTPALTMGDAGAEDTQITFDGNAQDFYVGLDDTADDLILGLGSAVGTTGIIFMDENQDTGLGAASAGAKLSVTGNELVDGAADEIQLQVQGFTTQTSSLQVWEQSDGTDVGTMSNAGLLDISGELNYGSNDLSIIGYASAGEQMVVGTDTITTTATAAHGLTTVTFALCTLGEDPETGAGDAATCTIAVSGNVVTLKTWQDDFTAATEVSVVVHWLVVGTP